MLSNQQSLFFAEDVEIDPRIVRFGDAGWNAALTAWEQSDRFGLDIETFSTSDNAQDALNPWKGHIRLIQIGLPEGRCIIADLGGHNDDKKAIAKTLETAGFFSILKKLVESPQVQKVGQNLKFDLLYLLVKYGIQAQNVRDVMLLSQVMWAGLVQVRHGLEAIAARCGIEMDKQAQKSDWGWDLRISQLNYAAADCLDVLTIESRLTEMLERDLLTGPANAECLALPAFVQMEYRGFPVDEARLDDLIVRYQAECEGIIAPFKSDFPHVNPDSPKQLISAINQKYSLHLTSSDQDGLAPHWGIPALKALSLWRSMTTYIDYLRGCKQAYFDGAVRGAFRQLGPKGFGRSLCGDKDPKRQNFPNVNLQNPPNPMKMPAEIRALGLSQVRSIFRVPDGYVLIIADLSQAHSRIAAQVSADKVILKSYLDGYDNHCIIAARLAQSQGLHWTVDDIAKWRKDKSHENFRMAGKLRNAAKPVYYGSLNKQGWKTLQATVLTDAGFELADDAAKDAAKAWHETYADLSEEQDAIVDDINEIEIEFGGVVYGENRGLSGRRLWMQKMISDYRPNDPPSVKATDAVSFVWTSTEADVVKLSMAGLYLGFLAHPEWGAYMANMAHDELDVVCKEEFKKEVATFVQTQMRAAMSLFVSSIQPDEMDIDPVSTCCKSWDEK
jgi:DNA polymerase I-like protein with 3'-5' exonuclease and polymerase domains